MKDYRDRIYEKYNNVMCLEASTFDRAEAVHWGKAYNIFLREWFPQNKSAKILDVGCGSGKLLYFFQTKGYENLQGVDRSPQQVALAHQVINNISETDVFKFLASHKEEYDLIVGLDIVEHLRKDEVLTFLDACHLVLRKGGRLILQTPNAESPWGTKIRYDDFTHEVAFTALSLGGLLSLSGFAAIQSRETGPVVHGVFSLFRFIAWKIVRLILAFWNIAETGTAGSGIYTRVFLISGIKN